MGMGGADDTGLTLSLGYGLTTPNSEANTTEASKARPTRLSSSHSTLSSFSADVKVEELSAEVDKVWPRAGDEDEDGNSRKKLRLTKEQLALLEDRFKDHSTLNPVRIFFPLQNCVCVWLFSIFI